jgi:hypothetical protein
VSDIPKDQEALRQLRIEAEREFMRRYPGVAAVALGFKVTGGKLTDQIAFRVYVREKKPPAQLKPEEMIPGHYQDVPTDVLTVPRTVPHVDTTPCADRSQHGTLAGGITINNMKADATGQFGVGTLGFFVTFPGVDPPYNIALVTNNHVIADSGGKEGDSIYQPAWKKQADGTQIILIGGEDLVGTVLKLPPLADDAGGNFVDAASVKLNICISSWCHTNCGVSFANEIQGLNINNSNAIADVNNTVAVGDTVFKVGRTTGRTVGRVTAVNLPVTLEDGRTVHNNIEIQAVSMQDATNCGGPLRFSDEGDSGSALIDANAKLIGLVHGGDPASPNLSHACHIQPVLAALGGVTPITTANPVHGNPAAVGMRADAPLTIDGRLNHTPVLRAKFLGCEEGQRVWALVERHRHEVVHLVNNNRRVTVAWRRNQGPAFLNRAMNNVRDPEQLIPPEIEGNPRRVLLEKMSIALEEHGSADLRAAIGLHAAPVLEYAAAFDSLHELVDELVQRTAEKEPA